MIMLIIYICSRFLFVLGIAFNAKHAATYYSSMLQGWLLHQLNSRDTFSYTSLSIPPTNKKKELAKITQLKTHIHSL